MDGSKPAVAALIRETCVTLRPLCGLLLPSLAFSALKSMPADRFGPGCRRERYRPRLAQQLGPQHASCCTSEQWALRELDHLHRAGFGKSPLGPPLRGELGGADPVAPARLRGRRCRPPQCVTREAPTRPSGRAPRGSTGGIADIKICLY